MRGTRLPLSAWLLALKLFVDTRRHISSRELSERLRVCAKTARRILSKLWEWTRGARASGAGTAVGIYAPVPQVTPGPQTRGRAYHSA